MKKTVLFLVITILIFSVNAQTKSKNSREIITVIPAPSELNKAEAAGWSKGSTWLSQHQDINRIGENNQVDLVFLGNSITQSWGGEGRNVWKPAKSIWEKYYATRKAANFGISGDRTQHILWRIENGNFDNIHPKVIVLMAGTNNIKDNSAKEIACGIEAILEKLHFKMPNSKVLLLGVFPRGEKKEDPLRKKVMKINKKIKKLQNNETIFFLDIGTIFLNKYGSANTTLMRPDFVHLQTPGYEAWAEAIEPTLIKLLGEK